MKKITEEAVNAFYWKQNKSLGNTKIVYNKQLDIVNLYLHDNKIAELDNNNLFISSCWWNTKTTKERLNWILDRYQMYIQQRNYIWYLVDRKTEEQVRFKVWNEIKNVRIF